MSVEQLLTTVTDMHIIRHSVNYFSIRIDSVSDPARNILKSEMFIHLPTFYSGIQIIKKLAFLNSCDATLSFFMYKAKISLTTDIVKIILYIEAMYSSRIGL